MYGSYARTRLSIHQATTKERRRNQLNLPRKSKKAIIGEAKGRMSLTFSETGIEIKEAVEKSSQSQVTSNGEGRRRGTRRSTVQLSDKQLIALIDTVQQGVLGWKSIFTGPFGERRILYADYIASGRPVAFIEEFIRKEVLPLYANTHTTTSVTGSTTTMLREEARSLIANYVNATKEDAIIFTGSGCTGALNRLPHLLGFPERVLPKKVGQQGKAAKMSAPKFRKSCPIVFVGPYEHHSNILPWREAACEVHRIPEGPMGGPDEKLLESRLKDIRDSSKSRLIVGSFSAASNITGIKANTNRITAILKKYNAISVWDYATAAPYVDMLMNPICTRSHLLGIGSFISSENKGMSVSTLKIPCESDRTRGYGKNGGNLQEKQRIDRENFQCIEKYAKDVIVCSPHKFMGGPGSPGLLMIKRRLVKADCLPSDTGGGTVNWVTKSAHSYIKHLEEREEGGTPDIIGSIRAGLAFQLKHAFGTDRIYALEQQHLQAALPRLRRNKNVFLLGSCDAPRLPILSFNIRAPLSPRMGTKFERPRSFLHHNFVAALLNDLFGIQARGGCACAGPYAADLLGVKDEREILAFVNDSLRPRSSGRDIKGSGKGDDEDEQACRQGEGEDITEEEEFVPWILKPGFVRVSLHYTHKTCEVDYISDAIEFIAEHGWKFLPSYTYSVGSGDWVHRAITKEARSPKAIFDKVSYQTGSMEYKAPQKARFNPIEAGVTQFTVEEILKDSMEIARGLVGAAGGKKTSQGEKVSKAFFKDAYSSTDEDMTEYVHRAWFMAPSEASMLMQKFSTYAGTVVNVPRSELSFTLKHIFHDLRNLREFEGMATEKTKKTSSICSIS